ncbi:ADP-ribosylation factor-related protein 1 isoform X1 [Antechinus flavipes]|uniref:ADP-ribosylation factor-related protein 1 isoform X1 n=1 Tax=Antechinus flavipes TaxID=38775 RepID=UPI0022359A01|nr:ADP-ribosylation factor-related protein 1 isoform X1 [Antechinus flavipes]
MYTLLSGLYKYMFRRDEYCILILGLDNAGKTTFLEQTKTRFNRNYKGMSLSKITTTVGLNIGTIDVGKARLMFWDLGGQEELQSLWDKYYAESHGVIYVIDSTDEERLSETKRAFEKMITSEALEGVPILVLANKQDVEGRRGAEQRSIGQTLPRERTELQTPYEKLTCLKLKKKKQKKKNTQKHLFWGEGEWWGTMTKPALIFIRTFKAIDKGLGANHYFFLLF